MTAELPNDPRIRRYEDADEARDTLYELLCDNKVFRFGKHKRPAFKHEDWAGGFVLTGTGEDLSRAIFDAIFPPGLDYYKDSGLTWK